MITVTIILIITSLRFCISILIKQFHKAECFNYFMCVFIIYLLSSYVLFLQMMIFLLHESFITSHILTMIILNSLHYMIDNCIIDFLIISL